MSRLKDQYNSEIREQLTKKFGYTNEMQVPKLAKIVVNMGVGEAKENEKLLEAAAGDMETITGQKPILTRAKKSIANFKIREVCRSAARLHFAATECTSSSTDWLTWHFPVSATSAV